MRQFLTIAAAFTCAIALGQKPNINKAKVAFDKGNLAEAKTMIDLATEYEKTMGKAKTWYYRGMIYASIDTSTNDIEAMKVAMQSFSKALEIDPEQKSTSEFTGTGIVNVDTQIQNYFGFYYNRGVEFYQSETFVEAAESFERAHYIIPADTNSILNAAYAASAGGDDQRAKANYMKALDAGMRDQGVFLRLYNLAVQAEDLDEAYAVLDRGREVHPRNIEFQKYQINILIQQEKIDEAKSGIEAAISNEPNNPDLHFSLGVIHEELKNSEGARTSYKNAIDIDGSHYNSNFNLGVMSFNEASELIKAKGELSYKETKKIAELDKQIKLALETALPLWEKLNELKGEEYKVVETLGYIYNQLKMNDKSAAMYDKLETLTPPEQN